MAECNPTGVVPIGSIPFLGCCRPDGCRSWVQYLWHTRFEIGVAGADVAAAARMQAFEDALDMLAEFPFTTNPVSIGFVRRGGLIGNKTIALHPDDPPLNVVTTPQPSGPCASSLRWAIDDGGVPEFTVLSARKIRVLLPANYCLLDRQYWSGPGGAGHPEAGSPILPIPGTIVRDSFTSPLDIWTDIDMPSGGAIVRWFDEWCDKVPDGLPD